MTKSIIRGGSIFDPHTMDIQSAALADDDAITQVVKCGVPVHDA